MINLTAEIAEALAANGITAAGIEAAAERAVRKVLAEQATDKLLDVDGLAELLSCSAVAVRARVRRDPELAGLVVRMNGRRRFRKSEVLALVASRRAGAK